MILRLLTLAALVGALAPAPAARPDDRHRISAQQVDGEWRCSIVARQARLDVLLDDLATQCGVSVEGLDPTAAEARVAVDLRDRPVRHVLDVVLGSVGRRVMARTGTWRVVESLRSPAPTEDLRAQALSAYLGALREFPDHPAGADALMSQARIESALGNLTATHIVLDNLVERFPDSELVPTALFDAAGSLIAQRDWEQAAIRLADLLRLEREHEYEVGARTELARCTVWMGEADRAMTMLDALDSISPPADEADEQARLFVRARAHVEVGAFSRAGEVLERATRAPVRGQLLAELHELRARVFEGTGRLVEAAESWLARADMTRGSERTIALRHAAQLALESGDEISVLMIHALAEEHGLGAETSPMAEAARERLALDEPRPFGAEPLEARLARAEELLASGHTAQAAQLLGALDARLAELDADQLQRFALAYGRALALSVDVEQSLEVFRRVLPGLEDPAHRREVYLLAGELLEAAGRVDDAIEAYQGRL